MTKNMNMMLDIIIISLCFPSCIINHIPKSPFLSATKLTFYGLKVSWMNKTNDNRQSEPHLSFTLLWAVQPEVLLT